MQHRCHSKVSRWEFCVKQMMVALMRLLAALTGVALLASYGGALHPAGDSLAVFRFELAIAFVILAICASWGRAIRWPLLACGGAVLVLHIVQGRAALPPASPAYTLYQQNLHYSAKDRIGFLDHLRTVSPDFITLQEVSGANLPVLSALRPEYPAQHHCPLEETLGEAVLSRFPMVAGSGFCTLRDGIAGMQVVTPEGPVWLLSLHIKWPWPYGQAQQLDEILPDLPALDGPVVLAGDFNAVAWSHALRRVERATGTRRIGHWSTSFELTQGLRIGIDHVLTSPSRDVQEIAIQESFGSDHNGILAYLGRLNDG